MEKASAPPPSYPISNLENLELKHRTAKMEDSVDFRGFITVNIAKWRQKSVSKRKKSECLEVINIHGTKERKNKCLGPWWLSS
jgi:hypothetical protein